MLFGAISGGAVVGTKTAVAVMGGGISLLLGLIGLTWLLVAARQPLPATRRSGPRFLAIGSALFVVIGGAALFGGILGPIKRIAQIEAKQTAALQIQAKQNGVQTELLTQLLQHSVVENSSLTRIARMQSEQVTRAILSEPKRQDARRLNQYEYKVSSQNGEDGIIAEIFRRIGSEEGLSPGRLRSLRRERLFRP
jgi:hypothetical protein